MTRRSRTGLRKILLVTLLSENSRDVDEGDEQHREAHRRRSEEQSPDHPDSRGIANHRSFRTGAAEQRADKFWRDQRDDAGENAAEN